MKEYTLPLQRRLTNQQYIIYLNLLQIIESTLKYTLLQNQIPQDTVMHGGVVHNLRKIINFNDVLCVREIQEGLEVVKQLKTGFIQVPDD